MNSKTDICSSSLCKKKKTQNIILCVKGYKNKIRKSEKLNVDWLYQDTMIKNELVLIQRVSLCNSFVWKYILNLPFFFSPMLFSS